MKIIKNKISIKELEEMAAGGFGNLVKAVVDIERAVMARGINGIPAQRIS